VKVKVLSRTNQKMIYLHWGSWWLDGKRQSASCQATLKPMLARLHSHAGIMHSGQERKRRKRLNYRRLMGILVDFSRQAVLLPATAQDIFILIYHVMSLVLLVMD